MSIQAFIQVIEKLGFPIAASIALASVFYSLIKWVLERASTQYADHRKDMKDMMERHEEQITNYSDNLRLVTKTFQRDLKQREERMREMANIGEILLQFIGRTDKNFQLIKDGLGIKELINKVGKNNKTKSKSNK